MQRLLHRRQYILSPVPIECPFQHVKVPLQNRFMLYAHVDLPVTRLDNKKTTLLLLGDIFDYKSPKKSNLDILGDFAGEDLNSILEKSSLYSGRFVLIHESGAALNILHDATATRKVYYTRWNNQTWLSSQPQLLAHILGFKASSDQEKLSFYNSADHKRLNNADIGNSTVYDEVLQMMPNHFLDVINCKAERFWPNTYIAHRPLNEVARECAEIIKGYIDAISARYEVMLPVTAGHDSRVLLAATYDIREKVYYYINKEEGLSLRSKDISIPEKLFRKLGLVFHIEEFSKTVEEGFRDIYLTNNPDSSEEYLPHIWHYFQKFPEKVNLPGNCAAASWGVNRLSENKVTGANLARLHNLEIYSYGVDYNEMWLKGCRELCRQNNINVVSLFYWEERIANWGGQVATYKDIAQEEFNPFNSRYLMTLFHSVKRTHNNWPDHQLHRAIIRQLWPRLLKVPINPSVERFFLKTLKFFGLFNWVVKMKYDHLFE